MIITEMREQVCSQQGGRKFFCEGDSLGADRVNFFSPWTHEGQHLLPPKKFGGVSYIKHN